MGRLSSRLDTDEERPCELEDRSEEITQDSAQRDEEGKGQRKLL